MMMGGWYACACTCRGQRLALDPFLSCSLLFSFWNRFSSMNMESTSWLDWLVSEPSRPAGATGMHTHLWLLGGCCISRCSSHACTVSTLCTQPFLQVQCFKTVGNADCLCRGPEFRSQHTHGELEMSSVVLSDIESVTRGLFWIYGNWHNGYICQETGSWTTWFTYTRNTLPSALPIEKTKK